MLHTDDSQPEGLPGLDAGLAHAFARPTPGGSIAIWRTTFEAHGRYEIVKLVGSGGMGVVLEAHDRQLMRNVALKVLHLLDAGSPERRRRFLEEARIAAQLQHPGIMPLYDAGLLGDGVPFLTMKLVEGATLADRLRDLPRRDPGRRDLLVVLERVCEAVGYAHGRGVVHRDLKPRNVMLGDSGEVIVCDWGLAKLVAGNDPPPEDTSIRDPRVFASEATLAGSVCGTPAYMAPEQARGEVDAVDTRSDVFSLGAMLCEVLTGRGPYGEGSSDVLRRRAAGAQIEAAGDALENCGADRSLVDLVTACLAPTQAERPIGAADVARGLRLHREAADERARRAELEAAGAAAAARQERRARRLTLTLSLVVISALLAAAGTRLWLADRKEMRAARHDEMLRRSWATMVESASSARADEGAQAEQGWREVRVSAAHLRSLAGTAEVATPHGERMLEDADRHESEAARALETVARHRREASLVERMDEIRRDRRGASDRERIEAAYTAALAEAGFELDDPKVAEHMQKSPLAGRLAQALDDWVGWRRAPEHEGDARLKRLGELAVAIDPDPFRRALREAWLAGDLDALRQMATEDRVLDLPAATMQMLTAALARTGGVPGAVNLLASAISRRPGDFWLHYDLAWYQEQLQPPDHQGALASYGTALALRPDDLLLRLQRAETSLRIGRLAEARQDLAELERRAPESASQAYLEGRIAVAEKRAQDAERAFLRALERDRSYFKAALRLENMAEERGDLDGAERWATEALERGSNRCIYHYDMARFASLRGDDVAAERHYLEALRHGPFHYQSHFNLGSLLARRGDIPAAIERTSAARDIMPGDPDVHLNLGNMLADWGRYREARAAFEEARRLLEMRGAGTAAADHGFAVVASREAIERQLPDLIAGRRTPASQEGWLTPLEYCAVTHAPGLAVRLWERIETGAPGIFEDVGMGSGWPAVQAALRAVAAEGRDSDALDAATRNELQATALGWARKRLGLLEAMLARSDSAAPRVRRVTRLWLEDRDYARVREAPALEGLAQPARDAWAKFWTRVRDLRDRSAS